MLKGSKGCEFRRERSLFPESISRIISSRKSEQHQEGGTKENWKGALPRASFEASIAKSENKKKKQKARASCNKLEGELMAGSTHYSGVRVAWQPAFLSEY